MDGEVKALLEEAERKTSPGMVPLGGKLALWSEGGPVNPLAARLAALVRAQQARIVVMAYVLKRVRPLIGFPAQGRRQQEEMLSASVACGDAIEDDAARGWLTPSEGSALRARIREQDAEIERLREVAVDNDHEKRACESCGYVDRADDLHYDVAYGNDGDAEIEPTCDTCRAKILKAMPKEAGE